MTWLTTVEATRLRPFLFYTPTTLTIWTCVNATTLALAFIFLFILLRSYLFLCFPATSGQIFFLSFSLFHFSLPDRRVST